MNLDFTPERFENLLSQSAALIQKLYGTLDRRAVYHATSPQAVRNRFHQPLPLEGKDPEILLDQDIPAIFHHATLNISPRFFAYVLGGGSQMGIIADQLNAALNQNLGKWHLAPAATEIERTVIQWLAQFVQYHREAGGVLLSGGSEANLTCLRVARDCQMADIKKTGFYGRQPGVIYASEETHSCVDKSVEMLGIGTDYFRKIPVHANFTIHLDQLEKQIQADQQAGLIPLCVVGNAGTVNTGAVDPLDKLAVIARRYGLWFHVDGAYGAPAASLTSKQGLFSGLSQADSLALDPHKWLQVPFESGCALVRRWSDLHHSFSRLPSYLQAQSDSSDRWDWTQYNFQLTRSFKALKVWMQFQVYGARQLTRVIEDNIALAQQLVTAIEDSPDFQLMAPAPLSVVCFQYRPRTGKTTANADYYNQLNARMLIEIEQRGEFFMTGTQLHGQTVLRFCCVNHRATTNDIAALLSHLRDIGQTCHGA